MGNSESDFDPDATIFAPFVLALSVTILQNCFVGPK